MTCCKRQIYNPPDAESGVAAITGLERAGPMDGIAQWVQCPSETAGTSEQVLCSVAQQGGSSEQ